MINLKETYGKRCKIQMDESYEVEKYEGHTADIAWYYELIGSRGCLYNHSDNALQIRVKPKLARLIEKTLPTTWKRHQNADDAVTFILPNSDIEKAFSWIKPRKRHIGNPNQPHLKAHWFKSKGSEHATGSGITGQKPLNTPKTQNGALEAKND